MRIGRWEITGFLYPGFTWDTYVDFSLFRTPNPVYVMGKTFCCDFCVPGIGGRVSAEKTNHAKGETE